MDPDEPAADQNRGPNVSWEERQNNPGALFLEILMYYAPLSHSTRYRAA